MLICICHSRADDSRNTVRIGTENNPAFFIYFYNFFFLIFNTCSETRIKDGLQGDTRGEMKQTKT